MCVDSIALRARVMSLQSGAIAVCGRAGLPLTSAMPQMVLRRNPNIDRHCAADGGQGGRRPQRAAQRSQLLGRRRRGRRVWAQGAGMLAERAACIQSVLRACSCDRQVGTLTCSCHWRATRRLSGLSPACLCTLVGMASLLLPGSNRGLPGDALVPLLWCAAGEAAGAAVGAHEGQQPYCLP